MQTAHAGSPGPAALAAGAFAGERDPWANAANAAALVFESLPELNWAGFYFLRGGGLVVGPFQGRVACVRIPLGSGVCGTAAARRATLIVPDVHALSGPHRLRCGVELGTRRAAPGRRPPDRRARSRQPAIRPIRAADAATLRSASASLVAACDWRLAGIDGF